MSDPHHTPAATGHAHGTADHNVLGEIDKPATLFVVFGGIVALFVVQLLVSQAGVGSYTLFVQLAISTTQAGLVAYHFMHLKQGDKVVTLTALASVFWLGILFVLFMADYMTRHMVTAW